MPRELIVNSLPGETRIALLEDGEVVELGLQHHSEQNVLNGIYRGRVQRVAPSTQSAFVDIGLHRNAFLQVDQIPSGAAAAFTGDAAGNGATGGEKSRIEEFLEPGRVVLVQVTREPLARKGYRLTCRLNLQGRCFNFRPFAETGVTTERGIFGPRERVRVAALVSRQTTMKGEWEARPAAEQSDEETLAADISRIERDWETIRRESLSGPPACLRPELPLVFRYIRDVLSAGFDAIRVDCDDLYGQIVNFVRQFLPRMEHKVRLYSRNYPIFEEYAVEAALRRSARRHVKLPSGGTIVIEQTEAMVTVDVNSGKASEASEPEESATRVNLEAAGEIARQLRLRGHGGIVAIDFIDMKDAANRERVFQSLSKHLKRDPEATRLSPLDRNTCVAVLTRKKDRPSLETALLAACPACRGVGKVASLGAVCREVFSRTQKKAAEFGPGLLVRAAPEVASALRRSALLGEIRSVIGAMVVVEDTPSFAEPQYELCPLPEAADAGAVPVPGVPEGGG